MATKEIKVPDIGGATDVEVIELFIAPGDSIKKDSSLVTLESDKASMEIPSPFEGKIEKVNLKIGDKVSEGSLIATISTQEAEQPAAQEKKATSIEKDAISLVEKDEAPASAPQASELKVTVPDIGDAKEVEVIEVLVKPGSQINKDDSLITLESEKASMEIPSPYSGEIRNVKVKVGDKVSKGDEILTLFGIAPSIHKTSEKQPPTVKEETKETKKPATSATETVDHRVTSSEVSNQVHAGPAIRRIAREFGINLNEVKGSGPKNRILKEDLQKYVKHRLSQGAAPSGGLAIPKAPEIDFKKFGEIETVPLSKIKKLTGINVHRSWVTIPHVTQFGKADITDLEEFRKAQKKESEKMGIKLTPLVFIMKAVVASLKTFPHFNASLDASGENLILKKYFNLGIAVDTPNGLVVPVVKDVDKKEMLELAKELAEISAKAREKGLSVADMSGSCFTISSLGGIGGTAFTPIINAPDVAILGVSKSDIEPLYKNGQFVPRLMLPLSLSYDHRVIDGADGARFLVDLANNLSDIRTLLL